MNGVIKCSQGRERAHFFCLLRVYVLKAQQEYKQASEWSDESEVLTFKGRSLVQISPFCSVLYMHICVCVCVCALVKGLTYNGWYVEVRGQSAESALSFDYVPSREPVSSE